MLDEREIDLAAEAVSEYCHDLKERGYLDWIHEDDIDLLTDRVIEALQDYRRKHWPSHS